MAPKISSSAAWLRVGDNVSARVAKKPTSVSAAMRPQVVTTGSVIGTGPIVKTVFMTSGDSIMSALPIA